MKAIIHIIKANNEELWIDGESVCEVKKNQYDQENKWKVTVVHKNGHFMEYGGVLFIELMVYAKQADNTMSEADMGNITNPNVVEFVDPTPRSMKEIEKQDIIKALQFYHNDRSRASKALGCSERTLYRLIKDYNINI